MIKGLYETHLFVENLETSIDFYKNKLQLQQCYFEQKRRAAKGGKILKQVKVIRIKKDLNYTIHF
jgi:hypothetical protein